MGISASFITPAYHRVGRGACDTCAGPFSLLNPACAPCQRCQQRLCRRCFTRSCSVPLPFLGQGTSIALPFVPRSRGVCDSCWPEAEREDAFAAQHLPFLQKGDLVTRIQPSLLGEATTQVLLSLAPQQNCLRFRSMQLGVDQQPREQGELKLEDIAGLQSGAAAAAGAGLQRALGLAAAVVGGTSSGSGGGVAAPPYQPALVVHLVSARGRTVFIFACPDERSFSRWKDALGEALALAKAKNSSIFPPPAARAAAAAADLRRTSDAGARQADLEQRQQQREAFKARLGPVGMAHTAAIKLGAGQASAAAPPGVNPASLSAAAASGSSSSSSSASAFASASASSAFSGDALEALGRPPGSGFSAASLASRASQLNVTGAAPVPPARRGSGLLPMPLATAAGQAGQQAQAALSRATSAASSGFAALRVGLGSFARSLEASVPAGTGGGGRGVGAGAGAVR